MEKLYGVEYEKYVCGGISNNKLQRMGNEILHFYTETQMLKEIIKLKEDKTVGKITPFIANITRSEYTL